MGLRTFLCKNKIKKAVEQAVSTEREKFRSKMLIETNYELTFKAWEKYIKSLITDTPEFVDIPACAKPEVSIIIPVYNQFDLTMCCLKRVVDNTCNLDYEVILIDDCSSDKTKEINTFVPNLKVIRNEVNLGFLKNCNKAAQYAQGEYIYLLNNDTQILENAITELVNTFKKDKTVGAAGSKFIRCDGKLQEAGSFTLKNGRTIGYGAYENPLLPEFNFEKEVDYCSGASLMIKRELWEQLGGFDELFSPGYYEENDLCRRIKNLGYKVIYQPKSEIVHFISQTFPSEKHKILMETNYKKYCKKWGIKIDKVSLAKNKNRQNSMLQNIFSLRNDPRKTHKIITILGLKIKLKRKAH